MTTKSIIYLRRGRKVRGNGIVIAHGEAGAVKVKPERPDWRCVWLMPDEIEAGQVKPPPVKRAARTKKVASPRKVRVRGPEAPRWKRLVDEVRALQGKHGPDEWPAVKMRLLSELADELEQASHLFQK